MNVIASARLGLVLATLLAVAACSTARRDGTVPSRDVARSEMVTRELERLRRSPAELAAYARDAVVNVVAYKGADVLQSGTGFFIRSDGVLVTNLHVVAGAEKLTVELSDGEIFDNVYVLSRDDRRDLILLQIPAAPPRVLSVTDQRDIIIGERVYVIGNPLGLQGTFSDGLVSGKRVEEGVTHIQITAPISEGSSGGPVMNEAGTVIGVATSFYTDGQNLNLAIPAWHASGMLALAGVPTRFELVAGDLRTEQQKLVEARADESQQLLESLPRETQASLRGLGEYERQTVMRVLDFSAFMADEGWAYLEDLAESGVLAPAEIDGIHVTLERGRYVIVAVCDDDCTDLDIAVFDSAEEVVGIDTEIDPEPLVTLDVPYRQEYAVAVEMIDCASEDCVYSIAIFRQE